MSATEMVEDMVGELNLTQSRRMFRALTVSMLDKGAHSHYDFNKKDAYHLKLVLDQLDKFVAAPHPHHD